MSDKKRFQVLYQQTVVYHCEVLAQDENEARKQFLENKGEDKTKIIAIVEVPNA